ncbi:acid type B receptor subunit 1 [Seminavis robusta]|uniref:Acid type B receptor subunit 1 n=1 Tax=Seminavis robusta TaxID=568900 RepID=A0A9N8HR66_9STRA|nr:acid type B receptor subunit 1 [Seminavis robusta]|eukprot:Sro1282_g259010.1 acid type B receptor subunit 1 (839) ;mRNA; r:18466-20982
MSPIPDKSVVVLVASKGTSADTGTTQQPESRSEIVEVLDPGTNATYRVAHLLGLMIITIPPQRILSMYHVTYEAAGFVAAMHLNERNSSIVPDLAERMKGCDIKFTYEMADSQYNRLVALKTVQQVATRPDMKPGHTYSSDQWMPRPTAMIGAAASSISLAVANLAGIYQIPQISASSSATALDNKVAAPYFSRTYPTNQADAEALMIYFKSLGVTHFGCIYMRDLYGSSFGQAVVSAAAEHGIEIYFTAFEAGDDQSLKEGLQYLKSTQVRYFFAVVYVDLSETVFREGYNMGIMGHPGYTWLLGDSSSYLASGDHTVDLATESDIAKAINGVGVILPGIDIHPNLQQIMEHDFRTNQQLQQDFVAAHQPNLHRFFKELDFETMKTSIFVGMAYDAVISVGLAACQQSERFFSPEQLRTGIRQQAFHGATGYVTFNNFTGTRDLLGLRYTITNVVVADDDQQVTPGRISFDATARTAIEFPSQVVDLGLGPYVYTDNTTTTPPALPHVDVDMNFIPRGIQAFGWGLMTFIIVLSACCIAFAQHYRTKQTVAAAQPAFLMMISSGCLLMATAILPMSLQEPIPESGLDIACMSQLYLVCIGFCVSFSALFCKLYRINKLQQGASQFRRVTIDVKDVMYPLVIMVMLNLAVLVAWTVADPLKWDRREPEHARDEFNRTIASYAVCSSSNETFGKVFGTLLFAINFVALALANWESYKGQKLPSHVNETRRIAFSMFFLIEACLLGIPILLVVQSNSTGSFLVKAVLIFWLCAAILGPMFLPLWNKQTGRESLTRSVSILSSRNLTNRSSERVMFPSKTFHVGMQHQQSSTALWSLDNTQ